MIREYTNRECEANRLNPADIVRRYTAEEQALLDSLQGALARFSGEVVTLPPGLMKTDGAGCLVTRDNMTREQIAARDKIAAERRKMMCKNGCGVLAKYRNLELCTACYRAHAKSKTREKY